MCADPMVKPKVYCGPPCDMLGHSARLRIIKQKKELEKVLADKPKRGISKSPLTINPKWLVRGEIKG